jgi:Domain of unknown function (DUF4398)
MQVRVTIILLAFLTGCAGARLPSSGLADAKSALSAANAAGASDIPEGALQLKLSDDAINAAEALIREGDQERARDLLARAQVDANLALYIAREAQAKKHLNQFVSQDGHEPE